MYSIKVLGSKEFDRLPYEGIHDSLGLADVKRNKVFVRDTGVHELNRYLISHEIDHLVEEHATDEDQYGIRHKKGPKLFKDIFLPFLTGGLTGGQGGAISGALGGLQGFQNRSTQNSGSYQPQQQNSGSYSPSGGFGSPMNLFGDQSMGSASGSLPEAVSGSYQPTITMGGLGGSDNTGIDPALMQKLQAGNYSGRLTF